MKALKKGVTVYSGAGKYKGSCPGHLKISDRHLIMAKESTAVDKSASGGSGGRKK